MQVIKLTTYVFSSRTIKPVHTAYTHLAKFFQVLSLYKFRVGYEIGKRFLPDAVHTYYYEQKNLHVRVAITWLKVILLIQVFTIDIYFNKCAQCFKHNVICCT